jgi:glycosyltransferase involved in cell wall biosynthesis
VRLRNWIARQYADMIFLSAPRPLVAAAMAAHGRPVIFHAQHFLGKRYALAAAGWAMRHAHATVIADAEYVAAQYTRYVPPERMHVIYNGVSEIPFRARRFFLDRFWKIGLIGRIAPMKGQADFLRAAALLPAELINAKFVLCGAPMFAPPAYLEEVQRLAAGLPVDFLGWRKDIAEVLAGLDMLVVPSTSAEATTRVILEAFSAGVPVVAYSIGGIPEIIEESRNGFLVPECEPEALARKILQVTYLDLQPLVIRAREDWERNYTVERYREQMIGVMDACATTI